MQQHAQQAVVFARVTTCTLVEAKDGTFETSAAQLDESFKPILR